MPGIQELLADPDFAALSPSGQRSLLVRIDPEFGKLSDAGITQFRTKAGRPGIPTPKVDMKEVPLATPGKAVDAFKESFAPLADLANVLSPDYGEEARGRLMQIPGNLTHQLMGSLQGAGESMLKLDPFGTAWHMAGAVPGLGPATQQVANDIDTGEYSQALGHGLALGVDTVAPEVIAGMPGAVRTAKTVAKSTARGAARGAKNAPVSVTGAAAGGGIGGLLGGWQGAIKGAEVGGSLPKVTGGVKGAYQGYKEGVRSMQPHVSRVPGWWDIPEPGVSAPPGIEPIQSALPSGRIPGPAPVAPPSPTPAGMGRARPAWVDLTVPQVAPEAAAPAVAPTDIALPSGRKVGKPNVVAASAPAPAAAPTSVPADITMPHSVKPGEGTHLNMEGIKPGEKPAKRDYQASARKTWAAHMARDLKRDGLHAIDHMTEAEIAARAKALNLGPVSADKIAELKQQLRAAFTPN